MGFKTITAVASAAAALAMAAPAAALTVTFDVNVTSATGVDNFTPFSFQESWTFSPTDQVNPGTLGPTFLPLSAQTRHATENYGGSPATVAGSPLTSGLLAIAGFSTVDGGVSHVQYNRTTVYDSDDNLKSNNSTLEFFSSRTVTTDENDQGTPSPIDDAFLQQNYSQSIEGFGSPALTPASMTDAAFINYLVSLGPMSWAESASELEGGIFEGGPPSVTLGSARYAGTATVVVTGPAAAPEPSAWALMILGFGGVGAALRRRQRTTLAA